MSKNKQRFHQEAIRVRLWLEGLGLHENEKVAKLYHQSIRKGNFGLLRNYLRNRPRLIEEAEKITAVKRIMSQECPFHFDFRPSDFKGTIPAGRTFPLGVPFNLEENDLPQNIGVWGRAGGGKSNLVKYLIWSVQEALPDARFWVFDPSMEYRLLKSMLPSFKILRLSQMWDNMFEKPHHSMDDLDWINVVAQVLESEMGFFLASKIKLINGCIELFRRFGVFNGSGVYPTVKDFEKYFKAKYYGEKGKRNKDSAVYEPLYRRMQTLSQQHGYFCHRKSIPLEILQNENLIIEFDSATHEIYSLIIATLLHKLYHYRMREQDRRHSIHLNVIEEARIPFSSRKAKDIKASEPAMSKMIAQCRKFRIGIIMVTQEPSSISTTAKANVKTLFAMPFTDGPQLNAVSKAMVMNLPQLKYYSQMEVGKALVKYGGVPPFIASIPKLKDEGLTYPDTGAVAEETDAFLKQYRSVVQQAQQTRLGGAETNLDDIAPGQRKQPDVTPRILPPDAMNVLYALVREPFLQFSKIKDVCKISQGRVNKATSWLIENHFAHFEVFQSGDTKASKFTVLEAKAYDFVQAAPPKGRGSFKSKCYSHIICRKLMNEGWKATIEGRTAYGTKAIDVLAWKKGAGLVAYEVTLSFQNICENIVKDFRQEGIRKVVIVTEDIKGLEKAQNLVSKKSNIVEQDMVKFQLISDYFAKNKGDKDDQDSKI